MESGGGGGGVCVKGVKNGGGRAGSRRGAPKCLAACWGKRSSGGRQGPGAGPAHKEQRSAEGKRGAEGHREEKARHTNTDILLLPPLLPAPAAHMRGAAGRRQQGGWPERGAKTSARGENNRLTNTNKGVKGGGTHKGLSWKGR